MERAVTTSQQFPLAILNSEFHGAPNLLHDKYGLDVDGIVEKIRNFANECPVRSELKYRSLLRP